MQLFSPEFEKSFIDRIVNSVTQELSPVLKKIQYLELKDTNPNLSRQQAADRANISLSSLNNYIKKGLIPRSRIGNRILIKQKDLDRAISLIK